LVHVPGDGARGGGEGEGEGADLPGAIFFAEIDLIVTQT
jgi:hypothetical protein